MSFITADRIIIKTPEQIAAIEAAGRLHARAVELLVANTRAGAVPRELDAMVHKLITDNGGKPTFFGYHGFPAAVCMSPEDVLVHGIPNNVPLQEGQIISYDIGVTLNGAIADACITVGVGKIDAARQKIMQAGLDTMYAGIEEVRPGAHLGTIGHAMERAARAAGYHIVPELTGHGTGVQLHEPPTVYSFGKPGKGPQLQPGMVITIEPVLSVRPGNIVTHKDRWTLTIPGNTLAAQFEHTVLVTEDGYRILTMSPYMAKLRGEVYLAG